MVFDRSLESKSPRFVREDSRRLLGYVELINSLEGTMSQFDMLSQVSASKFMISQHLLTLFGCKQEKSVATGTEVGSRQVFCVYD
jgi:hypothetical protein